MKRYPMQGSVRVAAARGADPDVVRALVAAATVGRDLGVIGA